MECGVCEIPCREEPVGDVTVYVCPMCGKKVIPLDNPSEELVEMAETEALDEVVEGSPEVFEPGPEEE